MSKSQKYCYNDLVFLNVTGIKLEGRCLWRNSAQNLALFHNVNYIVDDNKIVLSHAHESNVMLYITILVSQVMCETMTAN